MRIRTPQDVSRNKKKIAALVLTDLFMIHGVGQRRVTKGKVAGWVSFLSVTEQPNAIELEGGVGAAYQGKWVAAICGRRLIAYAFEVLDRDRVVACSAVGNTPSARLLQRLGFTQEQLLENADTIHGRVIDLMLYSIARG